MVRDEPSLSECVTLRLTRLLVAVAYVCSLLLFSRRRRQRSPEKLSFVVASQAQQSQRYRTEQKRRESE